MVSKWYQSGWKNCISLPTVDVFKRMSYIVAGLWQLIAINWTWAPTNKPLKTLEQLENKETAAVQTGLPVKLAELTIHAG